MVRFAAVALACELLYLCFHASCPANPAAVAATFMTVAASADAPQHGTVQHLEQRQEDSKQKEKEELTQLFLEYAKTAQDIQNLMNKLAGK